MNNWRKPEAIGQEFVANDYVSACVTIKCDFDEARIPFWGYGLAIPEGVDVPNDYVYFPCNHEYEVAVDELVPCEFTHTTSGPANEPLGASYPAYYWLDKKDDGTVDFHATKISTVEAATAANKS